MAASLSKTDRSGCVWCAVCFCVVRLNELATVGLHARCSTFLPWRVCTRVCVCVCVCVCRYAVYGNVADNADVIYMQHGYMGSCKMDTLEPLYVCNWTYAW